MIIKKVLHKFNKWIEHGADNMSEWFGQPWFLLLNIVFWVVWIVSRREPFPYGELTMVLSMQAIIMSVLILNAANRQQRKEKEIAAQDRKRDLAVQEEVEDIHDDVEAIKQLLDVKEEHE